MNNLAVANKASKNLLKQSILILISIMFFSAGWCSEEELKVELRDHRLTPEERAANTKVKIPLPEVIFESNFESFPKAIFNLDSIRPTADTPESLEKGLLTFGEGIRFQVQIDFKFPIRASLSNTKVVIDGQDVASSCSFNFFNTIETQAIDCKIDIFDSVGVHNFSVTVGASAISWIVTRVSKPIFSSLKPGFQYFPPSRPIVIEAEFFDPNYDIKPSSVKFVINNVDVIDPAPVATMLTPRSGKLRYVLESLPPGDYNFMVFISNTGGAGANTEGGFVIRKPSITSVNFLSPAENTISSTSEILVRVEPKSNISDVKMVYINGEEASSSGSLPSVYVRTVPLTEGENTITVRAIFEDDDEKIVTRTVRYNLHLNP
jgi:hypothetical protein